MYRPEIKVVDCTIRDGGLINNSKFPTEMVRAVFDACCQAGVDYCELGYRNSKQMFDPEEFGPWRFCDEDVLRQAVDGVDRRGTKLSVMMDAHKADPDDLLAADDSVVDLVRCSTYVKDVDKAIRLVNAARDKGYETCINIMAISHEGGPFLHEALQQIADETQVLAVYIVDSFGALYSEQVHYLVERYQMHIKAPKEVGAHFHNNQQLAFANTIEAIIKGANFLDGTLFGLGRAAGNCPTELLLSFLKNPKYDIVPLLKVIGEHVLPLKSQLDWGYHIPFMVSGVLDRHPNDAMQWMDSDRRDDLVGFYQSVTSELDD